MQPNYNNAAVVVVAAAVSLILISLDRFDLYSLVTYRSGHCLCKATFVLAGN